jgi:hypothetical protein
MKPHDGLSIHKKIYVIIPTILSLVAFLLATKTNKR